MADRNLHPRHLAHEALEAFLAEKLKITLPWGADINRLEKPTELLLPSAEEAPLPSSELLPYLEAAVPEEWALRPWQIYCYPLGDVIARLNDIHFTALQAPEDFQLAADLLFWWQCAQELKRLIAADQYIPSLKYHPLTPKSKKDPAFELHAGWEFCSDAYEAIVERYAGCVQCVSGAVLCGAVGAASVLSPVPCTFAGEALSALPLG